ncbi:hypothetical protein QBC46DRAFT_336908 [Diplogelasinospora grovesii]|uniref:FAD-binding PCMH-type domain-containing protein n=1 Tax=Diplogelasinospora grovesii TaxID=303347 RepID=A0AAN6NFY4_9PEZI|nr:hypothetical protein QBC46DRAFT_336908 [Diplogelasinospora grovesii]
MISSKFLALALAAGLPLSNALSIQERANITQTFQSSFSPGTKIYLASDPNFANETTQRWTVYEEPTYAAAIIPALASDVQTIVKIAGRYGIPFLATGGGHGLSTTLSKIQNGISIDLSRFKNVTINEAASTVTVGGANVFSDVFETVWNAGKEMATGSCACPGIVGATVGGGVGRLQGLHGLIIDTLVSVVMVTADGSLVTASETENADLFWGVRGAGPNFGIILWATYKIFDQTNGGYAFNADFIFPANESHNHWQALKEVSKNMPAELALISGINYNEAHGGLNILVNAVYYGPEAEGRALIAPFYNNNPLVSNTSYVHVSQLISVAAFGLFADTQCDKGKHVNTYTVGATGVDVPTWDAHVQNFTALYQTYPQARLSTAFVETFPNQAVLEADGSKTAVPQKHREITNYVFVTPSLPSLSPMGNFQLTTRENERKKRLWGYNYADPSIDTQINQFASSARTAFTATSGFEDLELYVTYAHGDEGPQTWYREKLGQLEQLKRKWDPNQLFGFMNPVPLK